MSAFIVRGDRDKAIDSYSHPIPYTLQAKEKAGKVKGKKVILIQSSSGPIQTVKRGGRYVQVGEDNLSAYISNR